jgi:hypothetical protein
MAGVVFVLTATSIGKTSERQSFWYLPEAISSG